MNHNLETVFCQLVRRAILPDACRDLQAVHEPAGCFGCGAPSRWCARCRANVLVTPELDLCVACLEAALAAEERADRAALAAMDDLVYCQIVTQYVRVSACLASQKPSECNQCPSPYRLCERCAERTVHYRQYGFCLHCAVAAYVTAAQPAACPSPAPVLVDASAAAPGPAENTIPVPEPRPEERKEHPVVQTKRVRRVGPGADQALFEEARALVLRERRASGGILRDRLHISFPRAASILEKLEAAGVVGKPVRGYLSRRPVLGGSEDGAPAGEPTAARSARRPDALFDRARAAVVVHQCAEVKWLTRQLKVGRKRATKLMGALEAAGVVSAPPRARRPRTVLVSSTDRARATVPPRAATNRTPEAPAAEPRGGLRERLHRLASQLREAAAAADGLEEDLEKVGELARIL